MMMDSPEPSKNNDSPSASALNPASSESPQVQYHDSPKPCKNNGSSASTLNPPSSESPQVQYHDTPEPSKKNGSSSASTLNPPSSYSPQVQYHDTPEPSKNNGSSASTLNPPSSESPQVQESPFLRFVSTLSPIGPVKVSHVAQGSVGLNSPPLVFKSPRFCHRETHLVERHQGSQSLSGEISQSGNGGNRFGGAPGESNESNSQQLLPERFITDNEVFVSENYTNTQNGSPPPSVDEYLADPEDIDRIYGEQSTDAAEPSLSDLHRSKENMLKFDRKDGPSDKAEEHVPLSEESNKVHPEKPAYGEEHEKIEGVKNDVEFASQKYPELESNLATDVFEKQFRHDSLPQDAEGCEDYTEMVSTSNVTAENILQDGSEAGPKYHGIRRRCLQFGETAPSALGNNKSHVTLNATSNKTNMIKLPESITSLIPQRGSGNFPVTGPKPSGIGLHLNSIINAMPSGCTATTGLRLLDGSQGIKSTSSISLHRVENMKRLTLLSSADGQSLFDAGNESHEFDASVASDAASAHAKRTLSPTDAGNSEEFNQLSPSKKKKKTSSNADDNGCKRCNCKKSKCLKLYCDCFAAGTYCTDPCACQGCLNRVEHAETVDETRQQIQSRNPLAFAPKIVQPASDISSNREDVNLKTPSSARHKRGCNCKRSMCLKKYCECFQVNVGCSSGCRCEGCKNVYGRKKDYVGFEHALNKERASSSVEKESDTNSTFKNKLEMVANKTDNDLRRLSPRTPSVQFSDQGKEAAKSRHGSHALLETDKMLGTAPYDSQCDDINMNMMDQLSPSDSVAMLLQDTFFSNPESISGASSMSYRPPSRLSSHGCIRQLPCGSLRWHSSPVTPRNIVGEAQNVQYPESDSRLFDITENETPDILKEASTPTKAVKVNSPTQKRVSPPQSHHGIGSSSSGGFRSARKYILKAVPSFPPLTPCVDSKGNSKEDVDTSDRQTLHCYEYYS